MAVETWRTFKVAQLVKALDPVAIKGAKGSIPRSDHL